MASGGTQHADFVLQKKTTRATGQTSIALSFRETTCQVRKPHHVQVCQQSGPAILPAQIVVMLKNV